VIFSFRISDFWTKQNRTTVFQSGDYRGILVFSGGNVSRLIGCRRLPNRRFSLALCKRGDYLFGGGFSFLESRLAQRLILAIVFRLLEL
jgi:hypothetical protein